MVCGGEDIGARIGGTGGIGRDDEEEDELRD